MKAVVLAALPDDHGPLKAASVALLAELERAGYEEVSLFELNNAPLAYCQGEFDCWVKTPGRCRADTSARVDRSRAYLAESTRPLRTAGQLRLP